MELLDRQRNRGHFLHELGADQIGERAAARAGDEDAAVVWRDADFLFHALEEFQQLLRLLGLVALVILPDHLVGGGLDHHGLHRGRAHVHADGVYRLMPGLAGHCARFGEDARRQRFFLGRRVGQGAERDVNLGVGGIAAAAAVLFGRVCSVMMRVTH